MKKYDYFKYFVSASCGDEKINVSVMETEEMTTAEAVIAAAMQVVKIENTDDFGDGIAEIIGDTVVVTDDDGSRTVYDNFKVVGKVGVIADAEGVFGAFKSAEVPLEYYRDERDTKPDTDAITAEALEKAARAESAEYVSEDGVESVPLETLERAIKLARVDEVQNFIRSGEIMFEDGYIKALESLEVLA